MFVCPLLELCQVAPGSDLEGALAPLLRSPKCVAVGECGLDYNRMFSPKEDQQRVFEAQVGRGVPTVDLPLHPAPRTSRPCTACCRARHAFSQSLRDAFPLA